MTKLYQFSDESVCRAKSVYYLGFDTVGRETVPLNQNHSIQRVFMRNINNKVYLNDRFFPEIGPDEEVAVTYIMHWKDCNKVLRKIHCMPTDEEEHNREILEDLAKKHCIWIRDSYSQQHQFKDMMTWHKSNLYGKLFPIFEFISCFNPKFASKGFEAATKMNIYLQDEILKDYFVKGREGFHFEVDQEILTDKEKFNQCLLKLYHKYPHLKEEDLEEA